MTDVSRSEENLKLTLNLQDVLFTVADTRAADTQTTEPCPALQPCNVHGVLLGRVLPGEEALHYLQSGLLGCSFHDLLQLPRELYILAL